MEPNHIDPKQIVADGYDRIAERYCAWATQVRQEERAKYTAVLLDTLPVGAAVLEGSRTTNPKSKTTQKESAMTHTRVTQQGSEQTDDKIAIRPFQVNVPEVELAELG